MYARWTGSAWVDHEITPPEGRSATTARSPTTAAASRSTTRTRHACTSRGRSAASTRSRPGPPRTAARAGARRPSRRSRRQERPAGLAARPAAVLERSQRRLDARRLPQLHRLPNVDHDAAAERRQRAARRRRRRSRRAAGRRRRRSTFDARGLAGPGRHVAGYRWDFGDGTTGTGASRPTPTRRPALLPGPDGHRRRGRTATLVEEILVDLPAAPASIPAAPQGTAVHGAVSPENQVTSGPSSTARRRSTAPSRRHSRRRRRRPAPGEHRAAGPPGGPALPLPGRGGQRDRQRIRGGPRVRGGQLARPDAYPRRRAGDGGARELLAPRRALRRDPAADDRPAATEAFSPGATGRPAGRPRGAQTPPSAFDGSGERAGHAGRRLGSKARSRAGSAGAPARRSSATTTDMGGRGLAPRLSRRPGPAWPAAYRLGGTGFTTGSPSRRCGAALAPHRRDQERQRGRAVRRRRAVHSSPNGAGSQLAVGPWHVMRNGTNDRVLERRGGRDRPLHARPERRARSRATTTWRAHWPRRSRSRATHLRRAPGGAATWPARVPGAACGAGRPPAPHAEADDRDRARPAGDPDRPRGTGRSETT